MYESERKNLVYTFDICPFEFSLIEHRHFTVATPPFIFIFHNYFFILKISFITSLSMVNWIFDMWRSHKAVDEESSLLKYCNVNILH
jgi:hypothetical protein